MTMLDDDRLSSLLGTAGAAFEVPESGPDDILARALGSPSDALAGAGDGKDDEAGESGDDPGSDDSTAPARPAPPSATGRGRRPPSPCPVGGRVHRRAARGGRDHRRARLRSCSAAAPHHRRPSPARRPCASEQPGHDHGPPAFARCRRPRRRVRCRALLGQLEGPPGGCRYVRRGAELPGSAEGGCGAVGQDRADRHPGPECRPRRSDPRHGAAQRARRHLRRLRRQLADAIGCRGRPALRHGDPPGASGQLLRRAQAGAADRPDDQLDDEGDGRHRTVRGPAVRVSPRSRPAGSST